MLSVPPSDVRLFGHIVIDAAWAYATLDVVKARDALRLVIDARPFLTGLYSAESGGVSHGAVPFHRVCITKLCPALATGSYDPFSAEYRPDPPLATFVDVVDPQLILKGKCAPFSAQITVCGDATVVGICLWHGFADASVMHALMDAWAAEYTRLAGCAPVAPTIKPSSGARPPPPQPRAAPAEHRDEKAALLGRDGGDGGAPQLLDVYDELGWRQMSAAAIAFVKFYMALIAPFVMPPRIGPVAYSKAAVDAMVAAHNVSRTKALVLQLGKDNGFETVRFWVACNASGGGAAAEPPPFCNSVFGVFTSLEVGEMERKLWHVAEHKERYRALWNDPAVVPTPFVGDLLNRKVGGVNSLLAFSHPHFGGAPTRYYPQHLNHDLLLVPDTSPDGGVLVYFGERLALERKLKAKAPQLVACALLLLLLLVAAATLGHNPFL